MGGYALGSAFDLKSGKMIMVALLLMVGSFYLGTIFGNNAAIYISQTSSNSSSLLGISLLNLSLFSYYLILSMLLRSGVFEFSSTH